MHCGTVYIIGQELHKDVLWWNQFLPSFNGVSLMWMMQFTVADEKVVVDACPKGAGGILWGREYFRMTFPGCLQSANIAHLETYALIIAVKVWGSYLSGTRVVLHCDKNSVVQVVTYGRACDVFLQAALRELVYLIALHRFELKVVHLSSEDNRVPDWLSRWGYGGEVRRMFRCYSADKSLRRIKVTHALLEFLHN